LTVDSEIQDLAHGRNFAAFTTLGPDGVPMTHVMWVDSDENNILVNTEVHRRKYLNVVTDPRVAVMIMDAGDMQHYADVRGRVVETVTGPEAREHIEQLAQRYMGKPFDASLIRSERVILRITPEHQRVRHAPA